MIRKFFCLLVLFMTMAMAYELRGAPLDSIGEIMARMERFATLYPQEKVYLHLDNTSYYRGDNIYFKAYVVNADGNTSAVKSATLYVELLNPGGEIIDRKVLKLADGQGHGDFVLNRVPFYSGFYEIRAYTKYMRNFGDDIVFSRIISVFDAPKQEGDFSEKKMDKYGVGKYVYLRPKPEKHKKMDVKFYPEGGYYVAGLRSRVAFEAVDKTGHPVEASGVVKDRNDSVVAQFATFKDGRGVFEWIPQAGGYYAVVESGGKEYKFDLPDVRDAGYVLSVDNLPGADSVTVDVRCAGLSGRQIAGVATLSSGVLRNSWAVDLSRRNHARFSFAKNWLPEGVTRVALFGEDGNVIADRLIFIERGSERLRVEASFDKPEYGPYEKINMTYAVKSPDGTFGVTAPFSLAVRDGDDAVDWNRDIMTDLLLMSEIKGYVANPRKYFDAANPDREKMLDMLLMVQGWRRYDWKMMASQLKFTPKFLPETTGIETYGRVISTNKKEPKPGVKVSAFIMNRNVSDENLAAGMEVMETDSLGRFCLSSDVEGEWNLVLSAREDGKAKDYMITLDRLFSPKPSAYRYTDMEIVTRDAEPDMVLSENASGEDVMEDLNSVLKAVDDSLAALGVEKQRIQHLGEVVVKGKKRSKESDIYKARSKSLAYYDVRSGLDDIRDEGEYIGDDIHKFLMSMNKNFTKTLSGNEEYLLYKGRMPLFVINYVRTMRTKLDYDKYKYIRLEAIKSIYITENLTTMCEYADPLISMFDIDRLYGCAVFIETYPDGEIPVDAGKGVRKTRLQGYDRPAEFYSPDYSEYEPEPDYRRTLYWNPDVVPDENGEGSVSFYNNEHSRKLRVSIETVTPDGKIGVLR